jgi:pilus assembly protein TadC
MIDFINEYMVYILVVSIGIYVTYSVIDSWQKKLDGSLIEALNNIAQNLESGNAIESAILAVSRDKSNAASKYFKKIIDETNNGLSFDEALQKVSKKTRSDTFSFVCDIIYLSQKSKGNIADSLKKLSENLWEIDHLQTTIISKVAGPVTTLKMLGIIIIPLLYYVLAAVVSSDAVVIEITMPFWIYFWAIALAMTFTDYFLFADWKDGIFLLPFSAAFIWLVITKLGNYVAGYLVG